MLHDLPAWLDTAKNTIESLFPIFGTVNLRRRHTDEGNGATRTVNKLVAFLFSLLTAAVIGMSAGLIASMVTIGKLESAVDTMATVVKINSERINGHIDNYERHGGSRTNRP